MKKGHGASERFGHNLAKSEWPTAVDLNTYGLKQFFFLPLLLSSRARAPLCTAGGHLPVGGRRPPRGTDAYLAQPPQVDGTTAPHPRRGRLLSLSPLPPTFPPAVMEALVRSSLRARNVDITARFHGVVPC